MLSLQDPIDYIWIAQKPCGCLRGLTVDETFVEEWKKDGCQVRFEVRGFLQFIPTRCWVHRR